MVVAGLRGQLLGVDDGLLESFSLLNHFDGVVVVVSGGRLFLVDSKNRLDVNAGKSCV